MSEPCRQVDRHDHCCHSSSTPSVHQTMGEMDFQRGIWQQAINGNLGKLENFIGKGHVNYRDQYGFTALHYACRHGHFNACKLLLSGGADINAQTFEGKVTPLHRAIVAKSNTNESALPIVKLLVEFGADRNLKNSDSLTAYDRGLQLGLSQPILDLLKP